MTCITSACAGRYLAGFGFGFCTQLPTCKCQVTALGWITSISLSSLSRGNGASAQRLGWRVPWGQQVCERPNLVVLLSALSGFGPGQFGRRKAPSLSALQILSYFVREAQTVNVFADTALVEGGCTP